MKGKENNEEKINGYTLSRQWFDFAFENPDKISPVHGILYFWLIELNNKLGWKKKFGLPTYNSMEAIGVKSYKTYKKAFEDLIFWGFVLLVRKAKNNHTSNIIELVNFTKSLPSQIPLRGQILPTDYQVTAIIDKQEETIQTDKTIKEEPEKIPALPKSDFIDLVIKEFLKVFPDYTIVAKGKERGLAGQLLGLWKKQNPDLNSDQILKSLHDYFERCKNIPDPWHKNKMSLGHMVSQYNDIGNILKNSEEKIVYIDAITDDTR